MIEGDKLTLTGKTMHGKNRVVEHGSVWIMTNHHENITPMPAKRSIKSVDTGSERWIEMSNDPDFTITPVIGD